MGGIYCAKQPTVGAVIAVRLIMVDIRPQLAEGLEKSRSESSLIVWDVTRTSTDSHTPTAASRQVPARLLAPIRAHLFAG